MSRSVLKKNLTQSKVFCLSYDQKEFLKICAHSVQRGLNPHTKNSTPTYIGNPHTILDGVTPTPLPRLMTFHTRTTSSHFCMYNNYLLCYLHTFYKYLAMKEIIHQILFFNDSQLCVKKTKGPKFLKNEEYKDRKFKKP